MTKYSDGNKDSRMSGGSRGVTYSSGKSVSKTSGGGTKPSVGYAAGKSMKNVPNRNGDSKGAKCE